MTGEPLVELTLAEVGIAPPWTVTLHFRDGERRRSDYRMGAHVYTGLADGVIEVGSTWHLWRKADGREALVRFQEATA